MAARDVFQRDDMIDPKAKDNRGRTHQTRMNKGLAPLGPDGQTVNLHHQIQSEKGSIAEVSDKKHKKYEPIQHNKTKSTPSLGSAK